MARIWEYPVPMVERFTLRLPNGSRVLSVQVQGAQPMVWVLVPDASANRDVERRFVLVGTGHAFEATGLTYLATFQEPPFVWHLFEDAT